MHYYIRVYCWVISKRRSLNHWKRCLSAKTLTPHLVHSMRMQSVLQTDTQIDFRRRWNLHHRLYRIDWNMKYVYLSVFNDSSVQTRWFQNNRQERKFVQKTRFWIFFFITKFSKSGISTKCSAALISSTKRSRSDFDLFMRTQWLSALFSIISDTSTRLGCSTQKPNPIRRKLNRNSWNVQIRYRHNHTLSAVADSFRMSAILYTGSVMLESIKLNYFDWIVLDRIESFLSIFQSTVAPLSLLKWSWTVCRAFYIKSISQFNVHLQSFCTIIHAMMIFIPLFPSPSCLG